MAIDWLAAGLDPGALLPYFVQSRVARDRRDGRCWCRNDHAGAFRGNACPTLQGSDQRARRRDCDDMTSSGYPLLETGLIVALQGPGWCRSGWINCRISSCAARSCAASTTLYGPRCSSSRRRVLSKNARAAGPRRPQDEQVLRQLDSASPTSAAETSSRRSKTMITHLGEDPEATIPVIRKICLVFTFQEIFNAGNAADIAHRCRTGKLGCVADEAHMAKHLNTALAPWGEKRREIRSTAEVCGRSAGGRNAACARSGAPDPRRSENCDRVLSHARTTVTDYSSRWPPWGRRRSRLQARSLPATRGSRSARRETASSSNPGRPCR